MQWLTGIPWGMDRSYKVRPRKPNYKRSYARRKVVVEYAEKEWTLDVWALIVRKELRQTLVAWEICVRQVISSWKIELRLVVFTLGMHILAWGDWGQRRYVPNLWLGGMWLFPFHCGSLYKQVSLLVLCFYKYIELKVSFHMCKCMSQWFWNDKYQF